MGFFDRVKNIFPVDSRRRNWQSLINESFAGAWQRGVVIDSKENLLRFATVYSCVTGIAQDIAKLHLEHLRVDSDGIKRPFNTRLAQLFRRPNRYQTQFQFFEQWVISKLLTGNTYALKQRGMGGEVEALYILEPEFVTVLVSDDGEVFYQLRRDNLSQNSDITVPASEIIHDRAACLYHPLVGISPIFACAYAATMGRAITENSAGFFQNNAQPGGILTAPGRISDETAARLKQDWQNKYSGKNAGAVAVLGDGLKFERMTVTATDAQLIEQLKWTSANVAQAFRYPLYKLGEGAPPISNNVVALNNEYYAGCLQPIIESAESVLDLAFSLGENERLEFNLEGLSRMDGEARIKAATESLKVATINEARAKLNLPPVEGGGSVYSQQQNYALEDLVRLRQLEFAQMEGSQNEPEPQTDPVEQTRALMQQLRKGLIK